MPKKATKAQIAAALKALGLEACPVEKATVEANGTIILYLVPNPEPVTWSPPAKRTRKSKSGDTK